MIILKLSRLLELGKAISLVISLNNRSNQRSWKIYVETNTHILERCWLMLKLLEVVFRSDFAKDTIISFPLDLPVVSKVYESVTDDDSMERYSLQNSEISTAVVSKNTVNTKNFKKWVEYWKLLRIWMYWVINNK